MTPMHKILLFLRENFVDGIETFVSHTWNSCTELTVTDINGDTAIVRYDEKNDVVVLE